MIETIAGNLVNRMIAAKLIQNDDEECYQYALVTLFESVIATGTLLLIGVFTKQIIGTVLFLTFFFSLRKHTGGYHAESFWGCYMGTTVTYLFVMVCVHCLIGKSLVVLSAVMGAAIVIVVIGTINHPNMDMNIQELKASKKRARIIILIEFTVILISMMLSVNPLYVNYMSAAVVLCALLLVLVKSIKQEGTRDD